MGNESAYFGNIEDVSKAIDEQKKSAWASYAIDLYRHKEFDDAPIAPNLDLEVFKVTRYNMLGIRDFMMKHPGHEKAVEDSLWHKWRQAIDPASRKLSEPSGWAVDKLQPIEHLPGFLRDMNK